MLERQEIFCHECNQYVQFNIDVELNGNHVLQCPKCGHEHCRVVINGIVTDERWGQRNGNFPTFHVTGTITYSTVSIVNVMINTSSAGSGTGTFYQSWANTSTYG